MQASIITGLTVQGTLIDVGMFVSTSGHWVVLVRAVFTAGFRVVDITVKSSFSASSVSQEVSIIARVAGNCNCGRGEILVSLAIGQSCLASS